MTRDPFEFTPEEQAAVVALLERLDVAEARRSPFHKWVRKHIQTEWCRWASRWFLKFEVGRLDVSLDRVKHWHDRGPLPEGHWFKELVYNRYLRVRWTDPKVYEEQWGRPYSRGMRWAFLASLGRVNIKADW